MDSDKVEVANIEIKSIGPWSKNRRVREENVLRLMESVERAGLIQPITVRPWPTDEAGEYSYQVITGAHRLKACERLGKELIPARIVEVDDYQAALLSYDENCARVEPSAAERSIAFGNLKEAHDAEHAEDARPGRKGAKARHGIDVSEGFAAMTSRATELHEKTIRRDLNFFTKLGREALERIVGTALDSYSELAALIELDADRQQALIEQAVRGDGVSAKPEAKPLKGAKMAQKRESKAGTDEAGTDAKPEGAAAQPAAAERTERAEQVGTLAAGHDISERFDAHFASRHSTGLETAPNVSPPDGGSVFLPQAAESLCDGAAEREAEAAPPAPFAGTRPASSSNAALDAFTSAARQRLQQLSEGVLSGNDGELIEFVSEKFASMEVLELGGVVAQACVEFLQRHVDFDTLFENISEEMDADAGSRVPQTFGEGGSDHHVAAPNC